jgi:hypothetical protein
MLRKLAPALLALIAGCGSRDHGFDPIRLPDLTPAEGFEYRLGPFAVPAGEQVQDCYFVTVPDLGTGTDPIRIHRILAAMNPGSHHFNVFRVKTIVNLDGATGTVVHNGECLNSSNWADWPLVANTQLSKDGNNYFDWTLPDGVAEYFQPGERLMLQTHYVNATTQVTPFQGKVAINFYRSTTADPIELGTLFATQQSIRVCESNPNPTYSGTCSFPAGQTFHIAAANGHFHSRGKKFQIFDWDGQSALQPPAQDRFYVSNLWSEPPMATGLDVQPPDAGGIWWTCEYQWSPPPGGCDALNQQDPEHANDCCYTFGPKTETNEHCNVFLYYWPKPASGDIFCN